MAKIAIIEDDPAIQQMYKLKLGREGFQVQVAANGREGLELVEKFHPDLILLDLMMPEMNGDEMLEKMRATNWGKDIKVIALTNISKTEAPAKLKQLGVDEYIVKAYHTPTEVASIIKTAVGTSN